MKKLFFLLLVANLVIWLWGQREQLSRLSDAAQPRVGTIRLLDDAEVAVRREQARARADAPPAAAPTISDTASASVPVVAAPIAAEPHPTAAPNASAAPSHAEVARDGDPAAPMSEPSHATPGEQAPPSSTPLGADALADTVAGGQPVTQEASAIVEPVAPAGPAGDGSAPAPTAPAAAVLVSEETALPAEPVAAETVPESVAADAGAMSVVESSGPPAEAVPPAEPQAREAAPHAAAVPESVTVAAAVAPAPWEPSTIAPPAGTSAAAAEPPAPPVEAREVLFLCESIGPFAERPAAVRFQAALAAPLRGATVREERSSRPVRHWVLAPVQPSKEATAEYLGNLSQAGVKDAWRIPNGPLAGRLAVGVFQSAENARKHADMLAAKGVTAEVLAPKDLEPIRVYWVDYERPADTSPPDPGAGKAQPARQVVARTCGHVAAP